MASIDDRDRQFFDTLAGRYGFSTPGVASMCASVARGNGRMAQFDNPDFGGAGQWMHGGMTMVGDTFDSSLKARVAGLCGDLAQALAAGEVTNATAAAGPVAGIPEHAGPNERRAAQPWWPPEFGAPDSSGAQNGRRYAYFAAARRLAVDEDGCVTLYDTLEHRISGVAQANTTDTSLTFSTGVGVVDLAALPVVPGIFAKPVAQSPRPAQRATPPADPFSAIEKLAELRSNGILTDEEFAAKKAEVLRRI